MAKVNQTSAEKGQKKRDNIFITFKVPTRWDRSAQRSVPINRKSPEGETFRLIHMDVTIVKSETEAVRMTHLGILTDKENRNYVYVKDESAGRNQNLWTGLNRETRNKLAQLFVSKFNEEFKTSYKAKEDDREVAGMANNAIVKGKASASVDINFDEAFAKKETSAEPVTAE